MQAEEEQHWVLDGDKMCFYVKKWMKQFKIVMLR